jgi:sugar lactone lactonase YvrE
MWVILSNLSEHTLIFFSSHAANEEVLLDFTKTHTEVFAPDGMTIDENGVIYVATWDGSRLMVIDPKTKTIKSEITFPTAKVTSVREDFENYWNFN